MSGLLYKKVWSLEVNVIVIILQIQQKINDFASDSHAQKHAFPPADKIYRAIV